MIWLLCLAVMVYLFVGYMYMVTFKGSAIAMIGHNSPWLAWCLIFGYVLLWPVMDRILDATLRAIKE